MQSEVSTAPEEHASPPWSPVMRAIVAVLLVVLFGLAISAFRVVIAPLVIGMVIAYVFRPVVRSLMKVTRLSRQVIAALLYLVLLALVVLAVILFAPLIVTQANAMRYEVLAFMRHLNSVGPDETIVFAEFEINVSMIAMEINEMLRNFARALAVGAPELFQHVAETILLVVFTFLISFYMTRDTEKIILWVEDLIPLSYRQDARLLLQEIDGVWSAFFRGQALLSLVVAIILTLVSFGLGLPQPILIGIFGGLLEFLPSVGHTAWGATVVIVALLQGSTHLPVSNVTFGMIVFVVYVLFTQLDINVLIPNIIGGHVDLHPMLIIIGIIVGAVVGGVLGIILAAPTIASLRVIGRYIYAKLLGMNPFPMVGPPSVPWHQRAEVARQRADEETQPRTSRRSRLRRRNQK
jgi:predicted PurR-regulated permease PerM